MGEKCHCRVPLACRRAATWDSEGRHAGDFFARKIRRLRPGLNPRSWVPEASIILNYREKFPLQQHTETEQKTIKIFSKSNRLKTLSILSKQ
jgi:hypothetical protein